MESMFSSRRSNKTARTGTRRSVTTASVYQATPFGTPPPGARQVMQKSVDTLPGSHLWVQPNAGSTDALRQGFGSSTCSGSSSWVLWRDSSDPGSLYPQHRRGRLCSAVLAIAVALVVLVVLAIAGLAVYMGALRIDPNNPELVFDGSLRVTEGDTFVTAMDNNASLIFREKAIQYQNMIDRVYQHSQLRPAYKKSTVERFENGSLVVFFRLHLDRRKIPKSFHNVEEMARDILIQELVSTRFGAFTGIKMDATSINIKRSLEDDDVPEVSGRKQTFTPDLTNNHLNEEGTSTTSKISPGVLKAIANVEDPTDKEDIPVIEGALVESPSSNHLDHSAARPGTPTTTMIPITTKTTKNPGSVVQGSVVVTKLLEPSIIASRTGSGAKKTQISPINSEVDDNHNKENTTTKNNRENVSQPISVGETIASPAVINPATKKATTISPRIDAITKFWATDGIRKNISKEILQLTTTPSLQHSTRNKERDDLEAMDSIGATLGEQNLLKKVGTVQDRSENQFTVAPHHAGTTSHEERNPNWNLGDSISSQTWTFSPPKMETDEPWKPIIPLTNHKHFSDDDEDRGSPGVAEVVVVSPSSVLQDSYSSRIGQPMIQSGVGTSSPDDKISRISLRVAGEDASGAQDAGLLQTTGGGGIIVRKHQSNPNVPLSHIVNPFAATDQLPILHQFRDIDAILAPPIHKDLLGNNSTRTNAVPQDGSSSSLHYSTNNAFSQYGQNSQHRNLQNQSSISYQGKPMQDVLHLHNNQSLRDSQYHQHVSSFSQQRPLKNESSSQQRNPFTPTSGVKSAGSDGTMQYKNRSSIENIYRKPVPHGVTLSQNHPISYWPSGNLQANGDFMQSNVLSKKPHQSPTYHKQPMQDRPQFSSTGEHAHFGTAEVLDSERVDTLSHTITAHHPDTAPTRYGARPGWSEGYRWQDHKSNTSTNYPKSNKPIASDLGTSTTPFPVFTLIPVRSNSGVGRPLRPRPRPQQSRYNDTSMSVVLNSQYHLRNGSQSKNTSSLVKSPLGDVIIGVRNNARPIPPTRATVATTTPTFAEMSASIDFQAHHYYYNSSKNVNRRITIRPPVSSYKPTTVGSVVTSPTWTKFSPTSESVIEFDFPPSRSGNITDMLSNHDKLLMLTKILPPTSKPPRHASPLSAVVVPLKQVIDHSPLSESTVKTHTAILNDFRNRHDRDPIPKPVNVNRTNIQSESPSTAFDITTAVNTASRRTNTTTPSISASNTTSVTSAAITNETLNTASAITTDVSESESILFSASPLSITEANKSLSAVNTSHHSVLENKHDKTPVTQGTVELPVKNIHFESKGKPSLPANTTLSSKVQTEIANSTTETTNFTSTTNMPLISISSVSNSVNAFYSTINTNTTSMQTTAAEENIATSTKLNTTTTATTIMPTTAYKSSELNSSGITSRNNTTEAPVNVSAIPGKVNSNLLKNESQNLLFPTAMKRKVSSNQSITATVKGELEKQNSVQGSSITNSSLAVHSDIQTNNTEASITLTSMNSIQNSTESSVTDTDETSKKTVTSTTSLPVILNTDVVTSTSIQISFGENGEPVTKVNTPQTVPSLLPTVSPTSNETVISPLNEILNESIASTVSINSSASTIAPVSTTSKIFHQQDNMNLTSFMAKNFTSQKTKESHRQPKMKPDDSYSLFMGRADFMGKHKPNTEDMVTTVTTTIQDEIMSTVPNSMLQEDQNLIITTEDYSEATEFTTATTEVIDTTLNIFFHTAHSNQHEHNFINYSEMMKDPNDASIYVSSNKPPDINNSTVTEDFAVPALLINDPENETSSQFTNYTISKVSGTSHTESLLLPIPSADVFDTDDSDDGAGEEYDISDYDILHFLYFRNHTNHSSRNTTAMTQEAVNALSKYAKVHTNPPPTTGTIAPTEEDVWEEATTDSSSASPWTMESHVAGQVQVKPSTSQHNNNHAAIPMLTKIYNKAPPTNPVSSSGGIPDQNSSVNGTACPSNLTLRCGDGECISSLSRCNQLVDCNDGTDERDCTCADYLRAQFLTRKLCDGVVDCWDFSDENNCEWCSPGQFVCPNSQVCVDQQRLCDGARDCPYGDDEKQCVTVAQSESTAGDLPYSSEGFLMVRKQGRWGKLCLQNFDNVVARSESSWEVADLGRAVCKAMTYSDYESVNRIVDVPGSSRADDSHYYELAYSHNSTPIATAAQARSSLMFQETQCSQKEVVKVSCKDLECGVRPQAVNQWARSRTSRIVGGGNAAPGSWPWQAALYKEGEFQCGATLIADRWLVSAGHCFYHALDDYWVARLGALRRGSSFPSPYEQLRPVSHIILHPGYVDAGFLNDISLLRLREPVQFSDFVRPVCLPPPPPAASIRDGRLCTVVGWGQLFEVGRIFPDTLQEVQLPIISTAECRKRTLFLPLYRVTDNMFCAGFDRGGRDACLGDSGGPLMCQEKDGRWSLYGVTSNGYGCARANRPGVYTKVANYVPWLQAAMAQQVTALRDSKTQCKGHRCPLGECLPQTRVCNGFMECSDGSDEKGCW